MTETETGNPPVRIDFSSLAETERLREVRTFTDPRRPGLSFTIEFQEPDPLSDYAAAALAKQVVQRYITGDPAQRHPPFPFTIDGREQALTPELIWDLCEMVVVQPEDGALGFAPYTFEDLCAMSFKCRSLYAQTRAFSREMYRGSLEPVPNALPDQMPESA
ncbi:MAG TPA: hypothetical protein VGP44_07230 [Gemmatimonadales bacterium]|nr:hypothetical protein [Gemmatimonadales bacterium]